MPTISRERAAALISAAKATVLKEAEVPDPPRSAAHFAFTTLYEALADNILASGRANVAVTYRELSLLASQRQKGKKIMASSLRKPFSQMLWRGDLLHQPFTYDGISFSLHLEPAGRRGRPLRLHADFAVEGETAMIDGGDPNGEQPILQAVRLGVERETIRRTQANIARRFVDTLRDTGFEQAEELSRWFARRGLQIPPHLVLALLLLFVLATTGAAAYAVFRYVFAHGLVRLGTDPNQQGQPPPGYHLRGAPSDTSYFPGGRIEARVTNEARVLTAIVDDLPERRQYPDSNFSFDWDLVVNGQHVQRRTTTPELACPLSMTSAKFHVVEGCAYEALLYTSKDNPPEALDQQGRVIARGNHIVDNDLVRGWLAGVATVPPQECYSSARNSPISATEMPGNHIRFVVRHGPLKVDETILKMSFGDGSVWTSAERPWRPTATGSGDAWDRWQTVIDHSYQRSGKYRIRFALYRNVDGVLTAHREVSGTVYVAVPPPIAAPLGLRPGLAGLAVDGGPPGSGTAVAHFSFNFKSTPSPNTFLTVQGSKGRFVAPQVVASMVDFDPHAIALGVVPSMELASSPHLAIDFGDGRPPEELQGRIEYAQGTLLGTAHEYLRSGTYQLTLSATGQDGQSAFELRRYIHVFADAPPAISE
jgi:hypothetical protein